MGKDRKILILGSLAAILLLVTGWLWMSRTGQNEYAQCQKSVIADGSEALGAPFTLTDHNGRRVTDTEALAKPSLLYFGYTYCPDICPLDTARNAEAVAILDESGLEATPVFISIDPERDTPDVLRDFVETMHERMIGLTGSMAEIDAVSKSWRNYYKLNNEEDPENYLVDHMTNTYLTMPGKGTVEFFGRDASPQEVARRTACFIETASRRK